MRSFVIKNGLLVSPTNGYRRTRKDVLVERGKIAAIEEKIERKLPEVDASGCIVAPGFIDIHTHCYPKSFLGLRPDVLGIERGSTTILDAGSSGADTYEDFWEHDIRTSKTKVFTLLNVSREGLLRGRELDEPEKIDEEGLIKILQKYGDTIVGLKARASASVVGEQGLIPIARAARLAGQVKKPLMVHVGNCPPALPQVLELLGKGDIVTHAWHGKEGGLLTKKGEIIPEAIKARERGVLFDVGHGVASFSLRVYQRALAAGFGCDLISTDLHAQNYEGPVYSLIAVVNKLIGCGESLEAAIHKCTCAPARHLGLGEVGELRQGFIADFTIMEYVDCREEVRDAVGDIMVLEKKLQLKKTIYSRGEESEIFEQSP